MTTTCINTKLSDWRLKGKIRNCYGFFKSSKEYYEFHNKIPADGYAPIIFCHSLPTPLTYHQSPIPLIHTTYLQTDFFHFFPPLWQNQVLPTLFSIITHLYSILKHITLNNALPLSPLLYASEIKQAKYTFSLITWFSRNIGKTTKFIPFTLSRSQGK